MKRILALCLVFMLSLSLVTPAAAGTEGPVTGRFGTSAVPTVNSIAVYTDAALTSPATSLTPQQTYWVKVSVTDNDGIGNLSYLYTHLWYDSDGGAPVWAGRGAGNLPASSMGYTFINTAGTWSEGYAGGTTWEFTLVSAPTAAQSADINVTTFDFVYSVKIGKIAAETVTSPEKWQVMAYAYDAQAQTAELGYQSGGVYGLPMNWYGEVIVPTSYTVDWGIVPAGMNFNSVSAVESITGGVTYIANGIWVGQFKAATSWTNGGSQTFTLSAAPTTVNTFALKGFPGSLSDPVNAGTMFDAAGGYVLETTGVSGTPEAGWNLPQYLYLKISPTVTNGGYFTGAITYGIRND